MGEIVDFDLAAVAEALGEDARGEWIDDIVMRFRGLGMSPTLAGALWPVFSSAMGSKAPDADARRAYEATLRSILDAVCMANRPRTEAECHRIAFGMRQSNQHSMRDVAKRGGVTAAQISKRVQQIQSLHGATINSFNKSPAAVDTYKQTNKRRRA